VPTRAAAPTRRGHPVDWREARVDGTAALLDGEQFLRKSRVNSSQFRLKSTMNQIETRSKVKEPRPLGSETTQKCLPVPAFGES